jgi:hypothetical protein
MPAKCNAKRIDFGSLDRRIIEADFDGGTITSNAGALLLGQLDRGVGLIRRFASCFSDRRNPLLVEHRLETLLGQRIFGLALGYEDLVDHEELRKDPVMAVLAGKLEGSAIFARQTTLGAKINNISLIVRDSNRLQLVGVVKSLPPFPPFRGRLVMLSGFVLP